jgi:hypothetical protein
VAALLEPDRYPDAKLTYPPGAELLSHAEVAELISKEIASPVEFTAISAPQWQAELEELAKSGDVVNPAMAQHISSVGAQLAQRSGAAIPPNPGHLAEIIGHPPLTMVEFIRHHRETLRRS